MIMVSPPQMPVPFIYMQTARIPQAELIFLSSQTCSAAYPDKTWAVLFLKTGPIWVLKYYLMALKAGVYMSIVIRHKSIVGLLLCKSERQYMIL